MVVLRNGDHTLWVAGGEHATRSDGTSSLLIAQAYGSDGDHPEGTAFTDELGGRWCLTHGITDGFYITGIVLEEEEEYRGRQAE